MERVCKMILIIGSVVAAMSAVSGAAPMEFTHQGRLTDATGVAVSGNVAIAFRLFDSSADGIIVWSETHPSVQVTDGLFAVILGSFSPLDADVFSPPSSGGLPPAERYLEIEVGGEIITPRTRLVSSPYAVTAHRVDGDLVTSPGVLRLGSSSDNTGVVSVGSNEGTGYSFGHSQGSNVGVGSLRVEPDSVTSLHGLDVDSDGVPDLGLELTGTTTSNRLKLFLDKNGDGTIGAGELSELSSGRVAHTQSLDADLDGNPEASASTMVTADSINDYRYLDSDDDGFPEQEISSAIVPTKSQHAINTKGTGAQNGRVVSISSSTEVDSALSTVSLDDDGDGLPENYISERVKQNESKIYVCHGTASNTNAFGVTISADSTHMSLISDGPGLPESSYGVRLGVGAVAVAGTFTPPGRVFPITTSSSGSSETESYCRVATDSDDDGIPEQEISSAVVPTKSQHAINTKGTGAQNGRVVSIMSETTVDSAMHVSSIDHNGDGLVDIAIAGACTVDSVYESTTFNYPDASSPTSESGRVFRSRKSKTYQEMHNTEIASKTVVEFTCDSATASSVWSADDFSGLPVKSLTIQASTDSLLNPIEHSSGAHLTPGGSWTNSSDAGLKENFESIDGDDLLSKIDQLEIHEWNYINESDNIKHIGPTAQDFESVFNLGTDGKSISTIDPAGIALAAIKALNEKSKRVDELEKDVEELKRIVEQLMNKEK